MENDTKGPVMRLLPLATTLIAMTFATAASAEWYATTKDDIFSGGKSAYLIGDVDTYHSLIFDCSSKRLTMAIAQKTAKNDLESGSFRMLIKVGQGDIHEFQGELSQRNEKYSQVETVDADKAEILNILKEIRAAKSKIQLGAQLKESDVKWSGESSSAGATKEADKFMSACKLK